MKKVVRLNESDIVRIVKRVINEQVNKQFDNLGKIFSDELVIGLEKTNKMVFDNLSKIVEKKEGETLSFAFKKMLTKAILNGGGREGVSVLKFCKELSLINEKFAEEFYKTQIETINKIRQNPKYSDPDEWQNLVKINFGDKVLEKYKRDNNMGPVKLPPNEPGMLNSKDVVRNFNRYNGPRDFNK